MAAGDSADATVLYPQIDIYRRVPRDPVDILRFRAQV